MNSTVSQLNQRATLLFLLTALMTAAWLAVNVAFPNSSPLGIPNTLALMLFCNAIILLGLWRGLCRTNFTFATRNRVFFAIALPLAFWIAMIWALAAHGTFRPAQGAIRGVPKLPLAIVLPTIAGLVLLTRSKRVASLLDAMPASWLIGLQAYRILGGIFLVYWTRGVMPGAFALPAGIGDVAVGLLALPAAIWVSSATSIGKKLGIAWNLLGLADFAVAIATGMMTSPGPAQLLAHGHPNIQIGLFPTVMIPAFAVPNSILIHVLSLWQLRRTGRHGIKAQIEQSNGQYIAPVPI